MLSLDCQEYNCSLWDLNMSRDNKKGYKWLQRSILNIYLKWLMPKLEIGLVNGGELNFDISFLQFNVNKDESICEEFFSIWR